MCNGVGLCHVVRVGGCVGSPRWLVCACGVRCVRACVRVRACSRQANAASTTQKNKDEQDLPWDSGAVDDDDDDIGMAEQPAIAAKPRVETNRFALSMRSDMDFNQAERFLQRAFVVRARTFGLSADTTVQARTNLLKCYIAQNKMDDIKQIRDHPKRHIIALERQLADFETDLRRSRLRQKIMTHARALGAQNLAQLRDSADTLDLRDKARPIDAPTDLTTPARFHGEFQDNRLLEYNALKAAPSPYTSATMMFPQHQAGAHLKEVCVCVCVCVCGGGGGGGGVDVAVWSSPRMGCILDSNATPGMPA